MTLWFVKQETPTRFQCGVVAHPDDGRSLASLVRTQAEVEQQARKAFPLDPDEPVESWPIRCDGAILAQHLASLILNEPEPSAAREES